MSPHERLYRGLLRVYPADFRRDYAEPMAQLFADQLRDAHAAGTSAGTLGLWIRILLDVLTSALSQRLEGDRTVAHSAAPLPTISSRALGIAGILAGVVLLAPFVIVFDSGWFGPHILLFNAFVIALALGMHRRQAMGWRRLAMGATAAVTIANAWYFAMTALSMADANPIGAQFGYVSFLAGLALWASGAAYGAASLVIGAFWRPAAGLLLVGSALAGLGMDRLGLVGGDSIVGPLSQVGIALHGAAWILLGVELAFRAPRAVRTAG